MIANCLLIKNENKYLKEHIEYYKSIGYDNIILYDNNDIDGEYPHDVIQDYIDSGFVIYNCVRGEEKCQFRVNSECLEKYKDTFEWISFFDCDEFLAGTNNAYDILNKTPKNSQQIYINWEIYGDNGLMNVVNDDYSVIKRFYHNENISPYTKFIGVGKPIIRNTADNLWDPNLCPHIIKDIITTDAEGNYIKSIKQQALNSDIKIAHFYTKTLEEYIKKCEHDVVFTVDDNYTILRMSRFFGINEFTNEKFELLKDTYTDTILSSIKKYGDDKYDIVITFVDFDDPKYRKQYHKELRKFLYQNINNNDNTLKNTSLNIAATRNYNTIQYLLRSIDKNMSWVNNVYLVVQSESQVPNWVNKETVKIITHDKFIPEEFLPTYNSMTIDMFIHKIPGLSERFFKFDDDIIILRNLRPTMFFNNKICKCNAHGRDINNFPENEQFYKKIWLNSTNIVRRLFNEEFSSIYYRTDHGITPMVKSDNNLVFNNQKNKIYASITKYRNPKNLVSWMYAIYQFYKNNKISYNDCSNKLLRFDDFGTMVNTLELQNYDTVCINDNGLTYKNYKYQISFLHKTLNNIFPDKCKYEK